MYPLFGGKKYKYNLYFSVKHFLYYCFDTRAYQNAFIQGGDKNLLPLYRVSGHFCNQTNSLQYICNVVDSSFLPDSQDLCGLKEYTHKHF